MKNFEKAIEKLKEELNQSEFLLYDYKHTKKILKETADRFFSDYQFRLRHDDWGNLELTIVVYDSEYMYKDFVSLSAVLQNY